MRRGEGGRVGIMPRWMRSAFLRCYLDAQCVSLSHAIMRVLATTRAGRRQRRQANRRRPALISHARSLSRLAPTHSRPAAAHVKRSLGSGRLGSLLGCDLGLQRVRVALLSLSLGEPI